VHEHAIQLDQHELADTQGQKMLVAVDETVNKDSRTEIIVPVGGVEEETDVNRV
jgi:hypothetical protein